MGLEFCEWKNDVSRHFRTQWLIFVRKNHSFFDCIVITGTPCIYNLYVFSSKDHREIHLNNFFIWWNWLKLIPGCMESIQFHITGERNVSTLRIFMELSLMNRWDYPRENEPKHDIIRIIFNRSLFELFWKNFQLRKIQNSPKMVVFGFILIGKLSPIH